MKIENRRLFVPWLRSPSPLNALMVTVVNLEIRWTERDICFNLERLWNGAGGREESIVHPFGLARKYGEHLFDYDWIPRDVTGTELV